MTISQTSRKAYKEVYRIIENSTYDVKEKIPNKFIKFLENSMDDLYEPNINYSIPIKEQKVMEETLIIMAIIYRDFICSKEEREKLIREESLENKILEEKKREKYNTNNLFAKKEYKTTSSNFENQNKEKPSNDQTALTIKRKQNIFNLIISKLKAIVKRKS